jgi:CMP-N-acetylneuraminic acid synthetase
VQPLVRSDINSIDIATSEDVILEVLSLLSFESEIITLLQTTSPFTVVNAWEK